MAWAATAVTVATVMAAVTVADMVGVADTAADTAGGGPGGIARCSPVYGASKPQKRYHELVE